jgi:diguanylate cyclase (GGDEF)-like protein
MTMPEDDFRGADDPGAGIFSLTQIRHLMRVEFSRAQRYGYPLSCVAVSGDRLGHLRDLYGYEFKEDVMDAMVRLLQAETRTCDYLGRLMDDRLLAILPHTPGEGGEVTAQRLLAAARAHPFQVDGHDLRVTLSVGISYFSAGNTMFFDALVDSAEAALRAASEAGGDRFERRDPGAAESLGAVES